MMAQVGTFSLWLALALAAYGALAALIGAHTRRAELWESARQTAIAGFAVVTLAAGVLFYALLARDFSVHHVALNSSRGLSTFYTITSFWSAHEGALLLWEWILAFFILLVAVRGRRSELHPYVLAVLQGLSLFFLFILVTFSNPLAPVPSPPANGRGMNPLLQDPGMAFHPPMLYLGYVGFSVPFAYAIAALVTGRLHEEWITTIRRWTLFAWYALTMGITLGAWWSYHTLGWGGYWAWDPVENASFMPWLAGTAFLHSIMVQERRRMLKVWNLVLIILAFSLSLFGTFLVRSGVLSSVHSFALSPWLGSFYLGFIAVVLFGSLGLVAARGERLRGDQELDGVISREAGFLLNNLVLVVLTFAVFIGTIFPIISEAIRGVKVSVGAPFFNKVAFPLGLLLLFLMGVGPLLPWRRASGAQLRRNFQTPLAFGGAAGLALVLAGVHQGYVVATAALGVFVVLTVLLEFARGARVKGELLGVSALEGLTALIIRSRKRYGGLLIHVGVAVVFVAITGGAFMVEREAAVRRGESFRIGRYELRYEGLRSRGDEEVMTFAAVFSVFNQGEKVAEMRPDKRFHFNQNEPTGKPAIRSTLREDIYLTLAGFEPDGSQVTVKAHVNPLIIWLWIGAFVMTIGTLLAVMPDLAAAPRRVSARERAEAVARGGGR
ncbi:MAG: heme lyase CcmF/NrfE family subunit [Deltaproteobacteria bacterium]|nr:heme lyase CcmF/NrfE family subunit [Deltaproteobacteria bacterium]